MKKKHKKKMDVDNSSMASNLEEVEQLGKEMEHLKALFIGLPLR